LYLSKTGGGGTPAIPSLGYGLLYNWYAATDARGVAPSGFRVPLDADFLALINQFGGVNNEGARNSLMGTRRSSDGHPYWDGGSTTANGTNSSDWAFYGYGRRDGFNGLFAVETGPFSAQFGYWYVSDLDSTSSNPINYYLSSGLSPSRDSNFGGFANSARNGYSVRCVSDTEPLTPTVVDADGNLYTWVQIGAQYWLQQNLKTTTYNNGDTIPTGLDNSAWAATTDGAWAYPNGDSNLPI
jgi:uncharacterized protein (TIGR02145 family)